MEMSVLQTIFLCYISKREWTADGQPTPKKFLSSDLSIELENSKFELTLFLWAVTQWLLTDRNPLNLG